VFLDEESAVPEQREAETKKVNPPDRRMSLPWPREGSSSFRGNRPCGPLPKEAAVPEGR